MWVKSPLKINKFTTKDGMIICASESLLLVCILCPYVDHPL